MLVKNNPILTSLAVNEKKIQIFDGNSLVTNPLTSAMGINTKNFFQIMSANMFNTINANSEYMFLQGGIWKFNFNGFIEFNFAANIRRTAGTNAEICAGIYEPTSGAVQVHTKLFDNITKLYPQITLSTVLYSLSTVNSHICLPVLSGYTLIICQNLSFAAGNILELSDNLATGCISGISVNLISKNPI